ncbi:MAG TPA: thiamine-phosphate kinase [Longimicrobiales bacterium]|nr:thiamine-phosphate kinase [Longimicrobiales bacterium]
MSPDPDPSPDPTRVALGRGAEFDLIRTFLDAARPAPGAPPSENVRIGAGDDCAIVRGEGIAVSVDMAVEGVHFRRDWLGPEEIGYRSVAAALSDLAAVAATPVGVFIALAATASDRDQFAVRVMEGAQAAAAGARATLLGGDVTRSPGPLVLDAIVLGNVLRPVLRRGASPGDSLWVTGELGAAAAAVRAWQAGGSPDPAARLAYALPAPRIAEARWLAERRALNALIDISDGLAGDAGHIAAASDVRIILDAASIPIHPVVQAAETSREDALRVALSGGDDYELCFAAPAGVIDQLSEAFSGTFELALTRVGSVHSGSGVFLRDFGGRVNELAYGGFDHFGEVP